jgi:class 3 adenylate cyclase
MADNFETRYTRSADGTNLAYQMSGDGRLDLVFMLGAAVPIDLMADDPGLNRLRKRLAVFSRTVWFENRGLGASGGEPVQSMRGEKFDEDLTAVLADAHFDQVVLVAASAFGALAIAFAAAHPERISALVLVSTYAHYLRDDDHPAGVPVETLEEFANAAASTWGTSANVEILAPSRAGDERFRQWWARSSRLGVSPDQLRDMTLAGFARDVRPLLSSVQAPTLVLHRGGDRYIRADAGRYLGEHIRDAKFVLLPGDDHLAFVGDVDGLVDEIEDFLTGRHQLPEGDVHLATVLFTDIVASTETRARLGPRRWRTLSDEHDAMVRAALRRHQGSEVTTTGDGFMATFDGGTVAVRCALDICRGAESLGLSVRAGVHCGEVEARGTDVTGMAVVIARRVCDLSGPGQVLLSETMHEMITGSDIAAAASGTHVLKGVPGEWQLWAVEN